MKKSALALAIAAALGMTAAQAESRVTTLYGSARVSVDWNKTNIDNDIADYFNIDNDPFWEVFNNASRLGVIGAEDLGGGWSAFYQYEFGVNVTGSSKSGQDYFDQSNRPRLVGLKSDFGSLSLGTQYTPFYNVLGYTDTFNSSKTFGTDYFLGSTTGNATSNASLIGLPLVYYKGIGAIRRGKSVVYSTPDWSGFGAQGMIVMDGHPPGTNNTNNRSPDAIDSWEANVTYKNGPWFVGGAYINDRAQYYDAPGETSPNGRIDRHTDQQYGLAGGWDNKQIGVGLSWQQYKPDDDYQAFFDADGNLNIGRPKVNAYTGQLTWYINQDNILRGTYSRLKPDGTGGSKINVIEVGYQYNLSKRTRLWTEWLHSKAKSGSIETPLGDVELESVGFDETNVNVVSTGIRHDF